MTSGFCQNLGVLIPVPGIISGVISSGIQWVKRQNTSILMCALEFSASCLLKVNESSNVSVSTITVRYFFSFSKLSRFAKCVLWKVDFFFISLLCFYLRYYLMFKKVQEFYKSNQTQRQQGISKMSTCHWLRMDVSKNHNNWKYYLRYT